MKNLKFWAIAFLSTALIFITFYGMFATIDEKLKARYPDTAETEEFVERVIPDQTEETETEIVFTPIEPEIATELATESIDVASYEQVSEVNTDADCEVFERFCEVDNQVNDQRFYYDVPILDYFQDYIFDVCDEYGVPYDLIFAMMWRESRFNPDAVGAAGEQGYLQILPMAGTELLDKLGIPYDEKTFEDVLSNPYNNVRCAVYLISTFYAKGYTDNMALMCYNHGEGGAREQWNQGVYETQYCIDIANYRANLHFRSGS